LARALQHINDKVFSNKAFLPNKMPENVFDNNHLIKDTTITIMSSIFKKINEWKIDHKEDDVPTVENDPNGWIQKAADGFTYCPRDFCGFYCVNGNSIKPIEHTQIE